jgi:hypothetical protein
MLSTNLRARFAASRQKGIEMSMARGKTGGRPAYRRDPEFREYPQRVVADAGSLV